MHRVLLLWRPTSSSSTSSTSSSSTRCFEDLNLIVQIDRLLCHHRLFLSRCILQPDLTVESLDWRLGGQAQKQNRDKFDRGAGRGESNAGKRRGAVETCRSRARLEAW